MGYVDLASHPQVAPHRSGQSVSPRLPRNFRRGSTPSARRRGGKETKVNQFPTKILLATDGSEATEQATEAAFDLSNKSGSELHVVHVWHDVPGPYAHKFVRGELRRQGQEILDEQVRKIEETGATVAKAHLRGGRTTDEVIKLGDELEAGLLVVGSRGLR